MLLLLACSPDPITPADTPRVVLAGVGSFSAHLSISLSSPTEVWVVCRSPDDPLEAHLVESPSAAVHDLSVRGLLSGTAYACVVQAPGGTGTVDLTTLDAPASLPTLTASGPGPTTGAYTLFNTQPGCLANAPILEMTDPEGRPRWAHEVIDDYFADIDAYLVDSETVHYGGGWGLMTDAVSHRGIFRDITLDGDVLIERTVPDFGLGFNHHSEPLTDGTYVSLTGHLDTDGVRDWNGVGIEVWHPTQGVVWSWDSQAMYDAGLLFTPAPDNEDLPYHANAVTLHTDSEGEAAWVSNYGMEQIWRIDRPTGEVTHVFGAGADFALTDTTGAPLDDGEYPTVQHGIDFRDDRMLVYDNGQGRGQSRVVEYSLDLGTNGAVLLWSWTEPGWFDPILGDADYLPDDHVLVTQGHSPCLSLFSPEVSELVEIVPPDQVVWRLTWPSPNWQVYRAQRYDGCDVFANGRYCAPIAERIAALESAP